MRHVISYSDPLEGLTMALVDKATAKKLPDELIVEILKLFLGDDIPSLPSRDLALVCKRWRTLLLETSTFWRKMRAGFVPDDKINFHASRLRRRLELSQRALLDVTLGVSGLRSNTSDILFEILGRVDVARWRSLKLEGTGRSFPSYVVSGYFKGTFTSLRYLCLEDTYQRDPYWPIYDLIAHSPPTITILHTTSSVPMELRTSAILRKVVDIMIPAHMYREVHEKTAVETVHLTDPFPVSVTLPLRLPKYVTIDIISGDVLSELDLTTVQSLDLRRLDLRRLVVDGNYTINLPSLVSLMLPKNICYIRGFVTPALKSLVVGYDYPWENIMLKESRDIITLFQKDPDQILMAPTTLDMCLSTTTAAAIAVLSHWTQLEHVHLDLIFGGHLAWNDGLIKALENSMCPNLITLRLRTDWRDVESEKWRQKAVELFKLRRLGPLERVSWTSANDDTVPAFILTRDDL